MSSPSFGSRSAITSNTPGCGSSGWPGARRRRRAIDWQPGSRRRSARRWPSSSPSRVRGRLRARGNAPRAERGHPRAVDRGDRRRAGGGVARLRAGRHMRRRTSWCRRGRGRCLRGPALAVRGSCAADERWVHEGGFGGGRRRGRHSEDFEPLWEDLTGLYRAHPGGAVVSGSTGRPRRRSRPGSGRRSPRCTTPRSRPCSITDLGIVEDVGVPRAVEVDLLPTFAGCPALDVIREDVEAAVRVAAPDASRGSGSSTRGPWTSDRITRRPVGGRSGDGITPPG